MPEQVTLAFAQRLHEEFNAAVTAPPEGLRIVSFPQSTQLRVMRYMDDVNGEDDRDLRGRTLNLKSISARDESGYEFGHARALNGGEAGWCAVNLSYKDGVPSLEGYGVAYVEPDPEGRGSLVTTYALNKRGLVRDVSAELLAGDTRSAGFSINPRQGQPKGAVTGRDLILYFDPETGPVLAPKP